VRDFPRRLTLPWVPLVVLVVGCMPDPKRPSAATNWHVTKKLPDGEASALSVAVLGRTTPAPAVHAILLDRLREAEKGSLRERARTMGEVGICAAHAALVDGAKRALDDALIVMGGVVRDTAMERRILSLPGSEQEKIFKGEPYERAICFLYRGLIYVAETDYDNASACFRSGELEDARLVDGVATRGSWLSLRYLNAFALYMAGRPNASSFPTEAPDGLAVGKHEADHNALVVVAAGLGPQKVHEQRQQNPFGLSYVPVGTSVRSVCLREQGGVPPMAMAGHESANARVLLELRRPTEDVYVQALSRGRRDMDRVLEAKERLARQAGDAATAAEVAGAVAGQFGGYGLPLVLLASVVSSVQRERASTTASVADLRQIHSIPGCLYVGSFKTRGQPVVLEVRGGAGNVLCRKLFTVPCPGQGETSVVLARVYK